MASKSCLSFFFLPTLVAGALLLAHCGGDDSTPGGVVADAGGTGDSPSTGGDGGSGSDSASATFTIGGTVTGLAGSGLVLTNGGKDLVVANGATTFTFPTPVAKGTSYGVTAKSSPTSPPQVCTVANGTGTVSGNVTNIAVTCVTQSYQICAMVTGLAGATGDAGITEAGAGGLVLHNGSSEGGPVDSVSTTANGSICFPNKVMSGSGFNVTADNPTNPSQNCLVTGGVGTVVAGDVNTVAVNCTLDTFTIGGNITGLAGSGGIVSLEDEHGNTLQTANLSALGGYSFGSPVASGQRYHVVTTTAPITPSQTCTVSNDTGEVAGGNVGNVDIDCQTNSFFIGGTLKLPVGTVTLEDNLADDLPEGSGTTVFQFATKVLSGQTYSVSVLPTPAGTSCIVTNGSNTVGAADVTDVAVDCTVSSTFSLTSAPQVFTVPAGVTSVFIKAWGAQGGTGNLGGNSAAAGAGGLGAYAEGNLGVSAGDTLNVLVGGQGAIGTAGFNGGAAGGGSGAESGRGGGGGGASDVRLAAGTPADRVIVAGGGGGGGGGGCEGATLAGGPGGLGGGGDGTDGTSSANNGGAGFGAIGSTGGAQGIGCGGFLGGPGSSTANEVGGVGGNGQTCCCFSANSNPSGGGGGGGLLGGGGGGGGSAGTTGCSGNDKGAGGGGAGGTSYIGGVTGGTTTEGTAPAGDGSVVIVYALP